MRQKCLYIWVENTAHKSFFEKVVKPRLKGHYDEVHVSRGWLRWSARECDSHITSYATLQADYLLVSDMNAEPCATAVKQKMRRRFPAVDEDRILVVEKEIESWYYAGLTTPRCRRLGVRCSHKAEDVTKECLRAMKPRQFDTLIGFMEQILNWYDLDRAREKSRSFAYFLRRFG